MEFYSIGMKAYLLDKKSECGYIGKEREIKSYNPQIRVYKSFCGSSYRFIKYNLKNEPISVLQIMYSKDKIAQVSNVYTLPNERKKGHAKDLFYIAKKRFKKVFHSTYLSPDGKIFAKKVN